MNITIHYCNGIPWQGKRINSMITGLNAIGIGTTLTESTYRVSSDPCVLFGTTRFKDVERVEGDWLLVDRACFGDPEYVRLGWNGHELKANYRLPKILTDRWSVHGIEIEKWRTIGSRRILCGQDPATAGTDLHAWYRRVADEVGITHFKPHPAIKENPLGLPVVDNFDDVLRAYTWNSTVFAELLAAGIDVSAGDPKSMLHIGDPYARAILFNRLAWTQWNWKEIADGKPIAHLFDKD